MISGCQRYIVEVRDVGTLFRDARDARDARTRVRIGSIFTTNFWER